MGLDGPKFISDENMILRSKSRSLLTTWSSASFVVTNPVFHIPVVPPDVLQTDIDLSELSSPL